MTDTNTHSDPPVLVASSSSPRVELGPAKGIVSAVLGAIVTAAPIAVTAVSDGAIDLGEAFAIVAGLLAGAGLIGGATYLTPTQVTVK
jgi:aconitase B